MATPVEAPKLGNTVEECLIAKWLKAKGDPVASGATIAEIETDKASFEVPAPAGGTLLEIFFPEGALVPVYTVICAIGEPGEDVEALRPKAAGPAAAGNAALERRQRSQRGSERSSEPRPSGSGCGSRKFRPPLPSGSGEPVGPALSPRARRFAEEQAPSGRRGRLRSGRQGPRRGSAPAVLFLAPRLLRGPQRMEEGAEPAAKAPAPPA